MLADARATKMSGARRVGNDNWLQQARRGRPRHLREAARARRAPRRAGLPRSDERTADAGPALHAGDVRAPRRRVPIAARSTRSTATPSTRTSRCSRTTSWPMSCASTASSCATSSARRTTPPRRVPDGGIDRRAQARGLPRSAGMEYVIFPQLSERKMRYRSRRRTRRRRSAYGAFTIGDGLIALPRHFAISQEIWRPITKWKPERAGAAGLHPRQVPRPRRGVPRRRDGRFPITREQARRGVHRDAARRRSRMRRTAACCSTSRTWS